MTTAKVVYGMQVSLDGFMAGPGGDLSWSVPDEELHGFHNRQASETAVNVYGRRLYETMRHWETADSSWSDVEIEFAQVWNQTPRLVFSRTLSSAEGGAELATGDLAETVAALREESGGEISVGGAGLAAGLIQAGLIDEYRLFVYPVVLGAGTPFFPGLEKPTALTLSETKVFGSGVVYLRYEAGAAPSGPM